MRSRTGLDVCTNADNSDLRSWRHTALIQLKAEELLSLSSRQELRVYRRNLHNPAVGLQLYGLQLGISDALVVRDIQPRPVLALLCSGLPDVPA